ncbi:MAG: Crp/Fnr family transcriptional regulator [Acidimicrobiales bacterium]|nr:Crp/Fnr family transcriptional regulator [Hyphomonadaceae bacterium]RZV44065.1 MAG: Crp/Fnr family transcriptional regulator [Acidimicrobiales bacterium]
MKDIFAAFDPPIRNCDALKKNAVVKTFRSKSMILSENDEGGYVYFILDGVVDITSFSSSGREIWHNRLETGQQFGEMSAITGSLRTANVVTVTKTKTAMITQSEFLNILDTDIDVCRWFLKDVVTRLDQSTRQIYELVALNVSKRICSELVRRTGELPDINNEYPLSPSPVLAQMARRLNTDRETISRAISGLAKEKLIRKDGRQITVLNKDALIKRALE